MMNTLEDHFRSKPDIHVCIDSFTHGMPFENGELDEELYEKRIQEIGYVVLVMSPWNNIRFFRRTALLFELYAAIKHGCKVEVAMGTAEKNTLIGIVKKQGVQEIQQALELIDFEKSESNLPALKTMKDKLKIDKSYDDANLLIINVVRDCLMAVISKFLELELPYYRYSSELTTFQSNMKIHENITVPNVDEVLHKLSSGAGNDKLSGDSELITKFYDQVAELMFLPEKIILEDGRLKSLTNMGAFKMVIKGDNASKNQNIFRIYSDIITAILGKRDPRAIQFFDLYVYSLFLTYEISKNKDTLQKAEDNLHHLMMLWESDIDEIIPEDNNTNRIKITFKTALPLSYYRYMQKSKNAKSLLLCLKNTEY
eukprot:gene61850-biopygen30215